MPIFAPSSNLYHPMNIFLFCRILLTKIRRASINNSPSIICNTCLAGFLYHDFGLRFNSPTINLMINAYDYNRFLEYILNKQDLTDIVEYQDPSANCPCGILNGDVRIAFAHYHSFEEAKAKWLERAKRIDYDNLRVIYCQTSVREDIIRQFDALPFKHKVALVNKPLPDVKSAFVIKGFEKEDKLGYIFKKYRWYGFNHYDQFGWIKFLRK